PGDRIVYAGVGKKRDEIRAAIEAGIRMFNVESREELLAINEVAGRMGKNAPIALRVNPDIDPKTHPYISTGLRKYKFGIAIEEALEHCREARALPNIALVGIHHHIGSQLTEVQPFADALARIVDLVKNLRAEGIDIRQIDVGGGLGIVYKDETPPRPDELAGAVLPLLDGLGCTLVLEPGRALVGNAGILVTRVLYVKRSGGKTFVIVDAAMNDLTRPSLYGAYHAVVPVRERGGEPIRADIVGPICESGDFLAKDREIPPVSSGDLLAVMSAGAYGFTMSSNYNSRPRVPEVMARRDRFFVVRERETLEDLVRGEQVPELLLA
ncbi:MAG: diaminopimelate decarboxylase, partial [Nitrospirae bacterium]|nr:diaminopimelate decarboxylase [Nitrospirota bacterium]